MLLLLLQKQLDNTDKFIDNGASLFKGVIHYITSLQVDMLIYIMAGILFVIFGSKLVKSVFGIFYYGSIVTIAILVIDYMNKRPTK
jgi:hypothetical protein